MGSYPLTAEEIWPKPPDAQGQSGGYEQSSVSSAECEVEEWAEPEPPRQKSVDIGRFARFPNTFFSSGMARKIGPSASLLYFALCENANRNREPSNTFKASDKALASETNLGTRTIRNVRIKLLEYGLVEYKREPGQSYTYTLLRQELKWLKLAERPRQKQRPRGNTARRAGREP